MSVYRTAVQFVRSSLVHMDLIDGRTLTYLPYLPYAPTIAIMHIHSTASNVVNPTPYLYPSNAHVTKLTGGSPPPLPPALRHVPDYMDICTSTTYVCVGGWIDGCLFCALPAQHPVQCSAELEPRGRQREHSATQHITPHTASHHITSHRGAEREAGRRRKGGELRERGRESYVYVYTRGSTGRSNRLLSLLWMGLDEVGIVTRYIGEV